MKCAHIVKHKWWWLTLHLDKKSSCLRISAAQFLNLCVCFGESVVQKCKLIWFSLEADLFSLIVVSVWILLYKIWLEIAEIIFVKMQFYTDNYLLCDQFHTIFNFLNIKCYSVNYCQDAVCSFTLWYCKKAVNCCITVLRNVL